MGGSIDKKTMLSKSPSTYKNKVTGGHFTVVFSDTASMISHVEVNSINLSGLDFDRMSCTSKGTIRSKKSVNRGASAQKLGMLIKGFHIWIRKFLER